MVEHALETLGVRYQSHKDYFAALLARSTADAKPDKPSPLAKPTDAPTTPTLSAYRELCTPLVHPPSVLDILPTRLLCTNVHVAGVAESRREQGGRRGLVDVGRDR